MNEYEIDCEVCESTVIVYNEMEDEPAFCPICGSALSPSESTEI